MDAEQCAALELTAEDLLRKHDAGRPADLARDGRNNVFVDCHFTSALIDFALGVTS